MTKRKAGAQSEPEPRPAKEEEMGSPVASSLPGELHEIPYQEGPTVNVAQLPPTPSEAPETQPVTKEELVKILSGWDEQIKEREDQKLHGLLDNIINQLAAPKPETQASNLGQNQGRAPGGSQGGGFSDMFSMLKQLGLLGNESSPFGEMEMNFAKMLQQGYYNYLKIQQRDFARKMGLPWHDVEGTTGA